MLNQFWGLTMGDKNAESFVLDKRKSRMSIERYKYLRLLKMFKYTNLPDTIPQDWLEMYLLSNGSCIITEVDKKLYALLGNFGGECNAYYLPKYYIVANPWLNLSKTYEINEDCVLMRNDSLWEGLYPLIARYSTLEAENLVTIRLVDVMLRAISLLSAPDNNTKAAAEIYLKSLEKGKLGVIAENYFLDGIRMQSPPSNNGSYLTQFIELQQYLIASFYNEVGLNANYNMKREAIGSNESALNEDMLLPLCEIMLKCRKEDIERVNEKYGTDISIDFDSSWKNNIDELEYQLKLLKAQANEAERNSQITNELDETEQTESNQLDENVQNQANELDETEQTESNQLDENVQNQANELDETKETEEPIQQNIVTINIVNKGDGDELLSETETEGDNPDS